MIRSNVSEIFGEINFKSSACRARGKASSAAHSVINKVSGPEGTLLQVICLTANSRRPPLARLAFPTFGWKTRLTLRASRPHASQAVGLLHVLYSGPEGTRTPDLCNANAALYQLSYRPIPHFSHY